MAAAQRVKELLGGYQQRNDTKMWELQIQWAGATTIVPPMLLSDGGVAEPAPFDLVGRGSAGGGSLLWISVPRWSKQGVCPQPRHRGSLHVFFNSCSAK